MRGFDALLLAIFMIFEAGALLLITAMLERKKSGRSLDRERLLFFFFFCLMPVCLGLLKLFGGLGLLVGGCLGGVMLTSALGFALSFGRRPGASGTAAGEGQPLPEPAGMKVYQIYYQGEVLGLISREGIDRLLANQLLKRQRTVELVDKDRARAQEKGVEVRLLKNPASGQVLVKVESRNP
ncbi:MAG: hypothetical protein EXS58_14720 [Candidatus Latescibacteria bacterium]|nr:hypothetical protein [Candidatus Latescibacterota bacterium]